MPENSQEHVDEEITTIPNIALAARVLLAKLLKDFEDEKVIDIVTFEKYEYLMNLLEDFENGRNIPEEPVRLAEDFRFTMMQLFDELRYIGHTKDTHERFNPNVLEIARQFGNLQNLVDKLDELINAGKEYKFYGPEKNEITCVNQDREIESLRIRIKWLMILLIGVVLGLASLAYNSSENVEIMQRIKKENKELKQKLDLCLDDQYKAQCSDEISSKE
ncbi:hypothetical protein ACFLZH_01695 [Patescibacteria group bacterium]